MSMTSIKLFASTDIGLRSNNEDSFIVSPDLAIDDWQIPASQQESVSLGNRGCLMVVADGMGGMNAGEVASDIAIKTVRQMFSPATMPADVLESPNSIKAYLKKVIVQADEQVKQHSIEDPSTEGMGSTIVMAWFFDGYVYVAWLGDSRAYSYIPGKGIYRLSKDHSYVQQLVDAKMLTEEEAMVHPRSNVITRSLGDTLQKAEPEVTVHPAQEGEFVLLCSDGLCGVCTDAEIADIVRQNVDDLEAANNALIDEALNAGGSDNITIALLHILSVDAPVHRSRSFSFPSWKNLFFATLALLVMVCLGFIGFIKSCDTHDETNDLPQPPEVNTKESNVVDSLSQTTPQDSVPSMSAESTPQSMAPSPSKTPSQRVSSTKPNIPLTNVPQVLDAPTPPPSADRSGGIDDLEGVDNPDLGTPEPFKTTNNE